MIIAVEGEVSLSSGRCVSFITRSGTTSYFTEIELL